MPASHPPKTSAPTSAPAAAPTSEWVVLWDVMDTLVRDPFYADVPAFFGMTIDELLAVKHPDAWARCERGEMSVADMERSFFADGRAYDVEGMRAAMKAGYRWLQGIPALLDALAAQGVAMHVVSNYTPWYAMVEEVTGLSRWMPWSFVSCDVGARKPSAAYYQSVLAGLGVAPGRCVFIDDREANCAGAEQAGMRAVRFESAVATQTALAEFGVL